MNEVISEKKKANATHLAILNTPGRYFWLQGTTTKEAKRKEQDEYRT